MDIFHACQQINEKLSNGLENEARDHLIKVLDHHHTERIPYSQLLNHLIRQTGLYPYLQPETASWRDKFAHESFKVDVGEEKPVTLHREQSLLLKRLLSGESLAISAPTSFGKSFIIDSFISIKNPKNVVIIVPTIALTDETRRRLQQKFSHKYKIITTADIDLSDRNIFIFPQERVFSYISKIENIDILIIDEFYKASPIFDKERAPSLLRAILKLSKKASQRYFLAPHISDLNQSLFTNGMDFVKFNFNTVFLEKTDYSIEIGKDENRKSEIFIDIMRASKSKSLVYAGSYPNIEKVANILLEIEPSSSKTLLCQFANWLSLHYSRNWKLTALVQKETGIHNGQMHRSLSQIQIKLFEEENGLRNMISTSSIIEGVNTSAENVIIWSNKSGNTKLKDFTFRNIMGRGGRMFRHFVGKIFILESPPKPDETQLDLFITDELLGTMDEYDQSLKLTPEQVAKIILYKEEMIDLIGQETFNDIAIDENFQNTDANLIRKIAADMATNPNSWNGLGYLNSENPEDWTRLLYKVIRLQPAGWDIEYNKLVGFIKALSNNWQKTIPELLYDMDDLDIGIDDFFKLERNATYKLSALLNDVNMLQKKIMPMSKIDISPFIQRVSHAFLPPLVYQLEEYGFPRMLAKQIHNSGFIDFEDRLKNLHQTLKELEDIGPDTILEYVPDLHPFDEYILNYFFDGISTKNRQAI